MAKNKPTDWENPVAARERLQSLKKQYMAAAEQIMAAVKQAFPVGCLVSARLGKSLVMGRVTGHSWSWWYEPDSLTIENVKTKKLRRCNPLCDSHEVTRLD